VRVRSCMRSLSMRVRSLLGPFHVVHSALLELLPAVLSYCSRAAHFDLLMAAILRSAVARV